MLVVKIVEAPTISAAIYEKIGNLFSRIKIRPLKIEKIEIEKQTFARMTKISTIPLYISSLGKKLTTLEKMSAKKPKTTPATRCKYAIFLVSKNALINENIANPMNRIVTVSKIGAIIEAIAIGKIF